MEETRGCDNCYYMAFDPNAYPCSRCVCNQPTENMWRAKVEDEPQADCFLCKWLGEVDVCGRCRNRNLFAEADTEPQQVVRLKHFCSINCNSYIKDEPQTDCGWGEANE